MSSRLPPRVRNVVLSILASATSVGCTILGGLGKFEVVDEVPGSDGGPNKPSIPSPTGDADDTPTNIESDGSVDAESTTPPDPGTPKKRVFVTSAMFGGSAIGGTAGADKLCQDAATNANLGAGAVWRAWLSTTTESAVERLDPHGPWALLNGGGVVANNMAELTSGTLRKAINITETGATTAGNEAAVWTGTAANGTATSSNSGDLCSNWAGLYLSGVVGSSVSTQAQWTSASTSGCYGSARLYCFEQ